ncbi:hypothetical protein, partial [Aeromonas salmonicida]|uniref:hypothetical protein n=1 Tax=Aeromonas salmonicida TaxID=645 RepID=UPI0005AADF74
MFLERRSNGVWYYKKTHIVDGTRKVTRKSLNTYDKKEAQLRAMHIYFNVEAADIPAQPQPKILNDGFVVSAVALLPKPA